MMDWIGYQLKYSGILTKQTPFVQNVCRQINYKKPSSFFQSLIQYPRQIDWGYSQQTKRPGTISQIR